MMFLRKRLRSVFTALMLLVVFSFGAGGGYLAGTDQLPQPPTLAQLLPQYFAEPEPARAGPPPLWVAGNGLMTPAGQHLELRAVTLAPDVAPEEAGASLGMGVTAVRIPVQPDAYLNDEAERQRVRDIVELAAEAGVYPLVLAHGDAAECGAQAEARAQFWTALAGDLQRWPAAGFDVGNAGCAGGWEQVRELAAAEIDLVRAAHPAALAVVAVPDGLTAAYLTENRVPREGVLYRLRLPAPAPDVAVQPPALAGVPALLELPELPATGDRLLLARVAMSDIIVAQPAGWIVPPADDPALQAVADTALRGAVRAHAGEPHRLPRLRAEGNRLVDSEGKPVKLHGFNRPGMEVFREAHRAPTMADLDEMVRRGANLLRLPVNPVWYRTDAAYRATALKTIAAAEQRGLYTLLDLHWSTMDGEAVCRPEMATATRFWQEAAFDLRGNTTVIYDSYNEPCKMTWAEWRPMAEQLIDAIRAVEPDALVMVPGVDWSFDLQGVGADPVRRDNIVYNAHDYPWKMYLDREKAYGYLADRYPVFVGEFGADYKPRYGFYQDPIVFTESLLSYAERRGLVGWAAWAWHDEITPNMFSDASFTPTPFGRAVLDRLVQLAAPGGPPPAPVADAANAAAVPEAAPAMP